MPQLGFEVSSKRPQVMETAMSCQAWAAQCWLWRILAFSFWRQFKKILLILNAWDSKCWNESRTRAWVRNWGFVYPVFSPLYYMELAHGQYSVLAHNTSRVSIFSVSDAYLECGRTTLSQTPTSVHKPSFQSSMRTRRGIPWHCPCSPLSHFKFLDVAWRLNCSRAPSQINCFSERSVLRDSVYFTTLKLLDYNVVMTFRFNNNNNNNAIVRDHRLAISGHVGCCPPVVPVHCSWRSSSYSECAFCYCSKLRVEAETRITQT